MRKLQKLHNMSCCSTALADARCRLSYIVEKVAYENFCIYAVGDHQHALCGCCNLFGTCVNFGYMWFARETREDVLLEKQNVQKYKLSIEIQPSWGRNIPPTKNRQRFNAILLAVLSGLQNLQKWSGKTRRGANVINASCSPVYYTERLRQYFWQMNKLTRRVGTICAFVFCIVSE